MKSVVVVLFIFISINNLFAQTGITTFRLPEMQQSTLMMGAGGSGVSLPVNDAISYSINPAQLGINKQTQIGTYFMTQNADWFPYFFNTIQFRSSSANVTYDLQNTPLKQPISVGIGYMHTRMSYGQYVKTGPVGPEPVSYYYPEDSFTGISLAVGYHTWFDASFGITTKFCKSTIQDDYTMKITAYDFGGMFRLPYSFKDMVISEGLTLTPKTSVTFGTAFTNIGGDISYGDSEQKDPLSRKSYLGYTLHLGADMTTKVAAINLFNYYFTVESDAYMVKRDTTGGFSYTGMYYGLRPIENLIGLRPSRYVSLHKGHVISLLETAYYSYGTERTGGVNSAIRSSSAFIISSEGISKMLAGMTDNSVLKSIAKYLAVEYHQSTIQFADSYGPYTGLGSSVFKGVVVRLKNFDVLF